MDSKTYHEIVARRLLEVDAQQAINEEWRDLDYYGCLRVYRDFWDEKMCEILEQIDERFGNKIERNGQ